MIISTFPDRPGLNNKLGIIARELGWKFTGPDSPADVHLMWDVRTYFAECKLVNLYRAKREWINGHVLDVRKSTIDFMWRNISSHTSLVQPQYHHGSLVKKSETQYSKSGEIIIGPVNPENGFIYQKLIDNRISPTTCEEWRFYIFDRVAWRVVRKTFDVRTIFERNQVFEEMELLPLDVVPPHVVKQINSFAWNYAIDLAELDVLRDSDGKWYVIDLNQCPGNAFLKKCKPAERDAIIGEYQRFFELKQKE